MEGIGSSHGQLRLFSKPPLPPFSLLRPLVVCWGGGVNSTAMLCGMLEVDIRPELILFADTGGEKPETMAFRDLFGSWLRDRYSLELVTVQNHTDKYDTLEQECLGSMTLPSLAYGWKKCSDKWKRRPQDAYMKTHPAFREAWDMGRRVTKAIGYDADEYDRAKILENDKEVFWYPLIDWGWGRSECVQAIERAGLPVPVKSACFFCPASRKPEVLALAKTNPELFDRAVLMERNARNAGNLHIIEGLGRHWSWEKLVIANPEYIARLPEAPACACGCFDGDDNAM